MDGSTLECFVNKIPTLLETYRSVIPIIRKHISAMSADTSYTDRQTDRQTRDQNGFCPGSVNSVLIASVSGRLLRPTCDEWLTERCYNSVCAPESCSAYVM